jgi:hypothetical protein
VLAAPSLIRLLIVGVLARRIHAGMLLAAAVGLWARLVATLAYDACAGCSCGQGDRDPYLSPSIFGMLITGRPETD